MTDTTLVRQTLDQGIATITLDSPHNRNALSRALVAELGSLLAAAGADDAVRAVVLTHTGGTFCAGADLTEAKEGSMTQGAHDLVGLMSAIVDLPKPVIGLVTGHVRAGGIGLLGACDIVVSGPDATFGITEARLGLAPAAISLVITPRLTPRGLSAYALTGSVMTPAQAQQIGLVTEMSEDLTEALNAYLTAFRASSPQGLRETKAITAAAVRASIAAGREEMAELSGRLFNSEEAGEGMRAFLERRTPRWALDASVD